MPHSKTPNSPYRLQVVDRALALLDALGAQQEDSSLAELSIALKLHKSTVHRLIRVLERHRLIDKNPATGRYHLGLKLFELGSKAIAALDFREHARPYLARVLRETEETVNLCILDAGQVLYIEKMESQRNLRMSSSVGHRFPAYCTALGKAILAELPDSEVDAILKQSGMKKKTPNTITSPAALKLELQAIRARGYAIDDEENEEGARCVGAAIRDHQGRVVGALSVSGPAFRVNRNKVPEIAGSVMAAAAELSADLGYRTQAIAAGSVAS
jgi:DNA-binding IclR family transcriptional regulator